MAERSDADAAPEGAPESSAGDAGAPFVKLDEAALAARPAREQSGREK